MLYWLIKAVDSDQDLQLQLIVTGMHLSAEFNLTYKQYRKRFKVTKKIKMLLSSDTAIAITKSMGLATIAFSECFAELKHRPKYRTIVSGISQLSYKKHSINYYIFSQSVL